MSRPPVFVFKDPELEKAYKALEFVLTNLSKDNFKGQEVIGNTNLVPDTQSKFAHGLDAEPKLWFPLEGNVYVPKNGIGINEIDVRSTAVSEQFRILLIA